MARGRAKCKWQKGDNEGMEECKGRCIDVYSKSKAKKRKYENEVRNRQTDTIQTDRQADKLMDTKLQATVLNQQRLATKPFVAVSFLLTMWALISRSFPVYIGYPGHGTRIPGRPRPDSSVLQADSAICEQRSHDSERAQGHFWSKNVVLPRWPSSSSRFLLLSRFIENAVRRDVTRSGAAWARFPSSPISFPPWERGCYVTSAFSSPDASVPKGQ